MCQHLNPQMLALQWDLEHSHYHYHNDGEHSHSHNGIKIIDEIQTENGVKHMHSHKHALLRKSCETYHN